MPAATRAYAWPRPPRGQRPRRAQPMRIAAATAATSRTCAWRSTACRSRTREAMLDGVRASERIIVGAYTDRARRRLPDARRPPPRRPHELPLLRARVGPLHARQARARARDRARAAHPDRPARSQPARRAPSSTRDRRAPARSRASARAPRGAAAPALGRLRRAPTPSASAERALVAAEPRRRLAASAPTARRPGRMNMISGTTQAGEIFSRSAPTRRCPRADHLLGRRPAP